MRKIIFLTILGLLMSKAVLTAGEGGLGTAGEVSGLKNTDIATVSQGDVPTAVGYILGQATIYLGIVFFLLIVYSGFLWMTASGDEGKVGKAKQILIAAVSGLVIVLSAYAIVNFVFSGVLGSAK